MNVQNLRPDADPVYGDKIPGEIKEKVDSIVQEVKDDLAATITETEQQIEEEVAKRIDNEIPAIRDEIKAEVSEKAVMPDISPEVETRVQARRAEIKEKAVAKILEEIPVVAQAEEIPLPAHVAILQGVPFIPDKGFGSYLACQAMLMGFHIGREISEEKLQKVTVTSAWLPVVRAILKKDGYDLKHHEIVDGTSPVILKQIEMGNPVILRDREDLAALCIGYEQYPDGQTTLIYHDPSIENGDAYIVDAERGDLDIGFEAAEIYAVEAFPPPAEEA